ncbi:MAG TPA: acyl-CoA carboxylase subunit beta [Mycobacteriales bacterium]|jgi:acetyl-CoA carboxylase carboxyltransferase component|nr:acyl-CoA carboxylase subunit beta [Mycobacteriales bacterium]
MTEETLREVAERLAERRADALRMGGDELVKRQHSLGKLTVRERLELLFDPGTFVESGLLAGAVDSPQSQGKRTPADGCVTGVGEVDGRRVVVVAYDFTVLAGSIGLHGERKAARARDLATKHGMPIVYLLDSAGARVTETVGAAFAGAGDLFRELTTMSGAVPQVAAMMGPCSAGTAYIPALCDFVPMVKGTSSMALAGVHLVRAATGEEVTEEEMGGSAVHNKVSGVADREAADDRDCLAMVRDYLSYMPSRYGEPVPLRPTEDPADRRCEELYDLVPANNRRAYDMRRVVKVLADDGAFFPMKPDWAKSVITGFARFGGRTAGVVASQPMQMGGALDMHSADKAARFVNLCDSFEIPLVFLVDVPGFLVGKKVEHDGIIRHGAKLLYNVSEATVPKVTVVLRKAYGAGYFVMAGRAYESDHLVAWPSAEFSVMGPEGAVNILFRKQLAAAESDEAREALREQLVNGIRQSIDPYLAARMAFVDDLIDPADTRRHICHALAAAAGKRVPRPARKRGVSPV